jgi:hypothetical protein
MYIYRSDEMATKGSNLSKYQSTTCSLLDLSSLAISTSVIVPTSYRSSLASLLTPSLLDLHEAPPELTELLSFYPSLTLIV